MNPSCLSEPALLQLVVASVKPPRGNLDFTPVTLREGGGVFLQDYDDIYPVLIVEKIPESVPITRGPRSAREGAGALCRAFWKSDVVYLGGGGGVPFD